MQTVNDLTRDISAQELDASFETLAEKLQVLERSLSEEERGMFATIITSASERLHTLQPTTETERLAWEKPISASATPAVRQRIMDLPSSFAR